MSESNKSDLSVLSDTILAAGVKVAEEREAVYAEFYKAVSAIASTSRFGPPSTNRDEALLQTSLIHIACVLLSMKAE